MSGQQLQTLLMIVLVFGVFYFLIIRPQQQREKQRAEMISSIEVGAEIITIGGIYGTVVETGERMRLRLVDGTEMEISPNAVAHIATRGGVTEVAVDDRSVDEDTAEGTDERDA